MQTMRVITSTIGKSAGSPLQPTVSGEDELSIGLPVA